MTKLGFVIDHNRCIGCHACTVACKMENGVPLGVARTWVKYMERGVFPNTKRQFLVLRCNHCDDAPCVKICPTVALFRRENGIVDFDQSRCIGCKACMQACPYDALYLDPESNTAAKCNFCAHRIDVGLEPACVIVCPTQSILWGDLDDPDSKVSKMVQTRPVVTRKPEQGTRPKLFYDGVDASAVSPLAAEPQGGGYVWAEAKQDKEGTDNAGLDLLPYKAMITYDIHHPKPWGFMVSSYLWTKSMAAGIMILLSLLSLAFAAPLTQLQLQILVGLSFGLSLITAGLLVGDLKRPARFVYVFLKPNPKSWLFRGALVFGLFGLVTPLWFLYQDKILAVLTLLLAVLVACYSAFLFAQAEGRDFWQSPSLFPHLLFGAFQAGSASLILAHPLLQYGSGLLRLLSLTLVGGTVTVGIIAISEVFQRHVTAEAGMSARVLRSGNLRGRFWGGFIGSGTIVPIILLLGYLTFDQWYLTLPAAALSLGGLLLYEDSWIKAGQEPPLS